MRNYHSVFSKGVDVYFNDVGDEISDAVIKNKFSCKDTLARTDLFIQ